MIQRAAKLVLIAAGAALLILPALVIRPLADAVALDIILLLALVSIIGILALIRITIRNVNGFQSSWATLQSVEQAIRLNLPLPRVIGAMAEQRGSRRLRTAQASLERGESLAVVLGEMGLPRSAVQQIAAAERIGRLPQILARILQRRREVVIRKIGRLGFFPTYPMALIVVIVGVTILLMVFVAPKYQRILRDFNIPLPWVTRMTYQIASAVGGWSLVIVAIVVAAALLQAQYADYLLDRLPWVGRMRFHRALGDALEFIADAVEAGRPIDASLLEAARLSANPQLRRKMENWMQAIFSGMPLDQAARSAEMPEMVYGMLATAMQTPDVAAVLRFLGRYYATRFSRAMMVLQAASVPASAIVMGIVVGWLALSVILPLVHLVDSLPYTAKESMW